MKLYGLALCVSFACSNLVGQQTGDPGKFDGVSATVWFQTSAEFRALCFQAYAIARWRLDADIRDSASSLPRAVVVDVDETVLDNSPHQAKLIATGTQFPMWWKEWVASATAEAIPGAVEFLTYAASRDVKVFYVTNRDSAERDATIRNLRYRGFPDADLAHVLTREVASSKEERRRRIAASHRIVLLVGDNLNDFAAVFERKPASERAAAADAWKSEFGTRFIVLPNPLYGDWESAVFQYERTLSLPQKHELRLKSMKEFP